MRLLSRVFGSNSAQAAPAAADAAPQDERGIHPGTGEWLPPAAMGASAAATAAGVRVTISGALALSAVWACVQLLASEVAALPLVLYRKRSEGQRDRAIDHPLFPVLNRLPNPEMTRYDMVQTAMVHLCTWGNAYLRIIWDRRGQVAELWPLRPDWMEVRRAPNGALLYVYTEPGKAAVTYKAYQIMHIRGMGFDGVIGYSPLRMHMETVAVGLAAKRFGAGVYGNGAWPGGVLKFEGTLTAETKVALKSSWEQQHAGPGGFGSTAVLDKGWDYKPVSLPPQEARFIESQEWTVAEIARIYGVPPHLIQDLTHATFSNIEHQSLDFLSHSLRKWLVNWEQAVTRDLLLPDEQDTLYAEFLTAAAVSVDLTTQTANLKTGVETGMLSINEARRKQNMNDIPGGDVHLVPLNMAPLGSPRPAPGQATRTATAAANAGAGEGGHHEDGCACGACRQLSPFSAMLQQKRADGADEDPYGDIRGERQALAVAAQDVFEDAARRVVRREAADIRRALDKHLRKRATSDFTAWLDEFYAELEPALRDVFAPALRSLAKQAERSAAAELGADDQGLTEALQEFIQGYLENLARDWTESSRGQLLALINQVTADGGGTEEIAAVVEERVGEWEDKRPQKEADLQSFEALNALVIAAYSQHDVKYLRWLASGTSCAFCLSLDGTIAGIADYFVKAGTQIDAGGELGVMRINRNKRHGPLHRGCDCVVCAAE